MPILTRRSLLVGAASLAALAPSVGLAQGAPAIHVLRDRNCGCCEAWVQILRADGFEVTTENSFGTLLIRHKLDNGIPQDMISCHTGEIDGYFIEGHVPASDVERLLATRPAALGLAVPGMPIGSPGMEMGNQRDAFDTLLVLQDGTTEVFQRHA